MEKCAGIAKRAMMNWAPASTAAQEKRRFRVDPEEWVYVPKGHLQEDCWRNDQESH